VKKPEEHGNHVIVASEPSTYNSKDWTLIEKNHCLMVETDGKTQVEKLDFPPDWNAVMN
jgi:glutamine amidotransferase